MALKIAFKDLSIDKLLVTKEDDPHSGFPLLRLNKLGVVLPSTLVNTTNHARGTKDTGSDKVEAINCSMRGGWDRTSWPIPYFVVDGAKQIFDRRHTFNAVKKAKAKQVPVAEYVRVYHPDYDWLSDRSVLEIGAIRSNVFSPVPADTKDHHFIHAAVNVFHIEQILDPTRDQVYQVLSLMGIEDRYTDKATIKRIVTNVINEMSDDTSVASKVSHHTDENEFKTWVKDSTEFHDNLETEDTIYITKNMDKGFNNRYAADVIRKMC